MITIITLCYHYHNYHQANQLISIIYSSMGMYYSTIFHSIYVY